ncbi:C4-dicarboxylate TRAP transporter substrate-binding protein [Thermodesulfobacteriota bacterium]
MNIKKNVFFMVAVALVMAATPALVKAKNYQASVWLSLSSQVAVEGYVNFAKSLKKASNGEVNFEVHVGGVLLPAKETLQGVGRGVAALGEITAAYIPADLPVNNVLGDLGFTATDSFVSAFTLTDVRINNAKITEEWNKHNIVYGGTFSTSTYHFQTMKPIRRLADAKGLKIRASVGAQVEFLKSIGAVPVSVPGSDIYSGLERGSIDGTLLANDALFGLKTVEVVKFVTMLPMGAFYDGATWGFNKDFWGKLSNKNRRIVLDELAKTVVRTQMALASDDTKAVAESNRRKIEWIKPAADLTEALNVFMKNFIATLPAKSMKKRKIPDPSDLIQDYLATEAKWKKLLKGVDRNDEAALIAIVKREIFDKVDEKTYGIK